MPLQDHIHLSTTLSGSPEYSPNLEWAVNDRNLIPVIFASMERSLNGKLNNFVLSSGGAPVQLVDYQFIIKVFADAVYTVEERADLLQAMNGKSVYFCDNFHAVTGTTHVADVKDMIISVGEFAAESPGLPFYYVDVKLTDNSIS